MTEPIVKLGSKLPKESDQNGLQDRGADLAGSPQRLRVALIVFDVDQVQTATDTGVKTVRTRVRRVEVIDGDGSLNVARSLITEAYEQRTGGERLPIEGDLLDAFTQEGK